jgi:hypothetical protein
VLSFELYDAAFGGLCAFDERAAESFFPACFAGET